MTSISPAPDDDPEGAPASEPARVATATWLVPTVIYVLALGGLGVTSKLALTHLSWQDLIFWSGVGYAFVVTYLLARGIVRPIVRASIKISRTSDTARSVSGACVPSGSRGSVLLWLARCHDSGRCRFRPIRSTGQRPARSHARASICAHSTESAASS